MDQGKENLTVVTADDAAAELARLRRVLLARGKTSLLGSMLGTLIHDLNNPLTAINGNIELLQLSPAAEDAKVKKRLDTIQTGTRRIAEKLRGVQLFTKAGRGDTLVDLNEIAREAARVAEYLPKPTKLPVTVAASEEPIAATGNPNQLALAVLAFIDNAFDAVAETDGPRVTVHTGRAAAGEPFISVTNNGPAIEGSVAGRIFEPFFTTKSESAGIGLAVANQIAAENRGRIEWRSAQGETEFVILLPAGV